MVFHNKLLFFQAMNNLSDKQEELSHDEWMDGLHALHVTRADMNRLIMNYLVTGSKSMLVLPVRIY